ncbi:hypothetical protein UF75_4414 [Desulfosporosinus sp. I2]|uniref:hypothetical protein n=1 Tax=Desulfosporosinus sp. I2 TaxID=1617025 RepID=UPI0005F06B95|nr:hypothetical protein [Desulfosporosinus sp. I2]KJR45214.1 hypothetical protein UF75_4414 [Desulfosporosinus sp. I2]
MDIKKINLTKQGKIVILGVLVLFVIVLGVFSLLRGNGNTASGSQGTSLKDVPLQGVITEANYHLVPILNVADEKTERVYINTEATPALFIATWDESSVETIKDAQDALNQMGSTPRKPLVLVSTFVKTTDQQEAVETSKIFQNENGIALPITVQIGPPTDFVQQIPSLVYTDAKGTHIVTEQNKIIEILNSVVALPEAQSENP